MSLSDEERSILALLAQGATDGAVARDLHLSMRTYRRRLRVLMEKLGAKSRFQAGVMATRHGWLEGSEGPATSGPQSTSAPRCSMT